MKNYLKFMQKYAKNVDYQKYLTLSSNNLKIPPQLPVRHLPGELPPLPFPGPGEVIHKGLSKKLRRQRRSFHRLRCLPEITRQHAPALVLITTATRSRYVQLQPVSDTIQSGRKTPGHGEIR